MKKPVVRSRSGRSCRQRRSRGEARPGARAPRSSTSSGGTSPAARHRAARRSGPRSRGGRSCRSRRRACRPAAAPARRQQRPPLHPRQPLDRPRRLAPAGVGPRGERAEVRAGRVEQDAVEAGRHRQRRRVGLDHGDAAQPEPPRLGGDLRRPAGSSSTEITSPRSPIRAAIWPVLIPGPAQRSRTCSPARGSSTSTTAAEPRLCGVSSPASTSAGTASPVRPSRRSPPAARAATRRAGPRAWAASRASRSASQHRRGSAPRRRPASPSPAARCRRRAASGRLRAQLLPPHPRQPERRRVGDRGRLGGRVVAEQRLAQLLALASGPPQHRVDEPGGVGGAGPLDQLDRLVDGGVVGGPVGEEQLVEAEPQAGEHRRVEQPGRTLREALDRGVGGPAPLHGAVGEALRLGALAAPEPAARPPRGRRARCGRRPRRSPGPPRRRAPWRRRSRSQSRQRVPAQVGVDRHRLAPLRLDHFEPRVPCPQPSSSTPHSAFTSPALTPTSTGRARRTPSRSPPASSR